MHVILNGLVAAGSINQRFIHVLQSTKCMHNYNADFYFVYNLQEKFNISNGVDGSATNYTIVYSDPASAMICYSTTLPAFAVCDPQSGVCKHVQNLPLSNHCSQPTGIRMSVYGTNVVKQGSLSNSTTVGRLTQSYI